ncbi:MAG: hypothetical protein Q7U03_08285 [Syntrophales bacterium]|nr:hypothetical protein [Syntrophales bacterium]
MGLIIQRHFTLQRGGRFGSECLADLLRNQWPIWNGISGRFGAESPLDPEVINKYLSQDICVVQYERDWGHEIDNVLTKKSDKINIGLIIEIKIKDIEGNKREQLENEEEQHFFYMIEIKRDKYKLVDRRHLKNILEEQKFSMTGLTDSETVKLGKLLNLDIIVLRLIYENSKVTKVLRVDTGEVLLFKTYQTEKEEGWVYYGKSEYGEFYYRNNTTINVSPKIIRVWDKYKYSKIGRDEYIRIIKDSGLPTDSYGKIDYVINLYELDCVNNTRKLMKNVEYNNEGNILQDFDVPHPKIVQIIPGEMVELLLKTVCK